MLQDKCNWQKCVFRFCPFANIRPTLYPIWSDYSLVSLSAAAFSFTSLYCFLPSTFTPFSISVSFLIFLSFHCCFPSSLPTSQLFLLSPFPTFIFVFLFPPLFLFLAPLCPSSFCSYPSYFVFPFKRLMKLYYTFRTTDMTCIPRGHYAYQLV